MSPSGLPRWVQLLSKLRAANCQRTSGTFVHGKVNTDRCAASRPVDRLSQGTGFSMAVSQLECNRQQTATTAVAHQGAHDVHEAPGKLRGHFLSSLAQTMAARGYCSCSLPWILPREGLPQTRTFRITGNSCYPSRKASFLACAEGRPHGLQPLNRGFSSAAESKVPMTGALVKAMEGQMATIEARYGELCRVLLEEGTASPATIARVNKELSALEAPVALVRAFRAKVKEIAELQRMVGDSMEDPELVKMAAEELEAALEGKENIQREMLFMLLPRDEAEGRDCILEVRAGSGGDEASLFAMEVFKMYEKFAQRCGWKFEVVSLAESDLRGYKEASASISGEGVYGRLQFESGVHRVQRVPVTEKSGRVHTSAASVVVLPVADEVDVQIRNEDLRIDTYRAGGAGGQSVNTTSSAVRITHLPSGIVVAIQDERSQHMNKAKALKVLRAKLYDVERQRRDSSRSQQRSEQIGSGDRSERIRTYNFPQGRVTDHRVNLTLHALDQILLGEELDSLLDALLAKREMELIASLGRG